jgi:hypothetical protein
MNFEKIKGAEIVRESEKALLVKVSFGDVCRKDVWFPKSQVLVTEENEVLASTWILNQKSERFSNELHHVLTEVA